MKGLTRFGRNTFLWFLLVALLPLTAVSLTTYFYMRAIIKDRALKDLEHDASRYRDHVRTALDAWVWRAEDFSSDGFIRDASQEIILGIDNHAEVVEKLNTHLRANKKSLHPDIFEVFIVDKDGMVVASSTDSNVGNNMPTMDYFRKPLLDFAETGGAFVGDAESPVSHGQPELVSSRILKDKVYQSPIGVIVLRININSLQNAVEPGSEAFGGETTGKVAENIYITNEYNLLIANYPYNKNNIWQHMDTKNIRQVLDTGAGSVGEYKNYLDTEVLGATLFIDETGWAITTERAAHEMFAPLRRLGYIFGGIAGGSLLLVLGLSFGITRGINRSIKELILGTERIASGDLDNKIVVKRRDELRTLSDSFNAMMHSLKTSNEERERLFSVVERAKVEWEKTFDTIDDAILSCDADHNIVRANRGASKLLGIKLKDLTQTTCHKAALSLSGFEELSDSAFKGLEPVSGEVHDREGDRTFLANIYPMVDKLGAFQGCVQILRDITAIKKAERELEERRIVAMAKLAELAEKRDLETGHHLIRIRGYCKILAEELRKQPKYSSIIDDEFIKHLQDASMLHDIGKVGIPDSILLKPGRLDPEEFGIIKTHTVTGDAVLAGPEYFKTAREICRHHHERYDGKGYPDGLKGEGIPLSARIVTLADTYDAVVSKRPYKEARTHEEARSIIQEESGKQFCPDVVQAFINGQEDFRMLHKSKPA
ncbi:MAG: HD domain-containing phosphohydrolase [Candidatus Brocadiales bacterium]